MHYILLLIKKKIIKTNLSNKNNIYNIKYNKIKIRRRKKKWRKK